MLSKKYYSQSGLVKLIDDKIEESKQLDYKEARALNREAGTKESISKAVSSFANSEGGVIIYGIVEKNHYPENLSFIDGNDFTKEWLENVIDTNISPKIQNIIIHPIRIDNLIEQTIYIVEIPQSPDSPHMANDNKYYRRYNFKSVPMEEYEIKNLYFKTTQTKLVIEDIIIKGGNKTITSGKLARIRYSIEFPVKNISRAIETKYKLEIHIPTNFYHINSIPTEFDKKRDRIENNISIYAISNISPLFQNEKNTICSVNIEINENNFMALDSLAIKAILYYSSGVEIKEVELKGRLKYAEEILSPTHFLNYRR